MEDKLLVIICRGVPGSGKSTWANTYPAPRQIVSTDAFFITEQGEYIFDRNKLGHYHQRALMLFKGFVDRRTPTLLLDNTNIKVRDYKAYVDYALEAGYTVVQKVFTGDYTSIHDVPLENVERMRATFQEDTTLPHFVWEIC